VEAGLEVVDDRVNLQLKLVPQLLHRIQRKELDVKGLAKCPPDLLWPGGPYGRSMLKLRTQDMEMESAKTNDEDYSGMFTCGRCKSKRTTFYLLQTRSADEPMTAFISCMGCGNKWKG
jgi:transcription elongation factor S-II